MLFGREGRGREGGLTAGEVGESFNVDLVVLGAADLCVALWDGMCGG